MTSNTLPRFTVLVLGGDTQLPPTTMASFELCVHVLGDLPPSSHILPITATASDYVAKLEEQVYVKKRNRFKDIDADDLILWKVVPLHSCHRLMY
jgi:Crinkler effector protein N-terminal domain